MSIEAVILEESFLNSRKKKIFAFSLRLCVFACTFVFSNETTAQPAPETSGLSIARVKYHGGGDWYNDPSCIPNLLEFVRQNTTIHTGADERHVELLDDDLFSYPIIFLTGHGKISFSNEEARQLRLYLTSGGFLYADDEIQVAATLRSALWVRHLAKRLQPLLRRYS